MGDVQANVEVRALRAEKLRELHGETLARYECWPCGRTGRTAEPTSVIGLGYPVSVRSGSPTLAAQIRKSSRPIPPG